MSSRKKKREKLQAVFQKKATERRESAREKRAIAERLEEEASTYESVAEEVEGLSCDAIAVLYNEL